MTDLRRQIEIVAAELDAGRLVTAAYLKGALPWDGFPRRWRLLFIAQRGLCSLCREAIPLRTMSGYGAIQRNEATTDHVVPRSLGGSRRRNLLLAHRHCNELRGNAPPSAELVALLEAVYERLDGYCTPLTAMRGVRRAA